MVARVSYNGYYASLPSWRRRFDSAHPLRVAETALNWAVFVLSKEKSVSSNLGYSAFMVSKPFSIS